ncbi:hypothetical protein F5Y09DRAFT_346015 [Xylaria sp. FL1042]|nr:hypothetical protein F5Y09DRAFT_346015 [Xylaria sp. FL1042]
MDGFQLKPEGYDNSLQRVREGAPGPEPISSEVKASTSNQKAKSHGEASWGRYAYCDNLSGFGNLKSSSKNHPLFHTILNQNVDKEKQNQGAKSHPIVNTSMPTQPTSIESQGPAVAAESTRKAQPNFGEPSLLHDGDWVAVHVLDDETVAEVALRRERTIDEFYSDHPEKKLEIGISPSTLNLAAGIVLKIVDDACYEWFQRWCPQIDLHEIHEALCVEGQEQNLMKKNYIVPPYAIDTSVATTTLVETYRLCQNIHPRGSGDIQLPTLISLIDQSALFSEMVKDSKRHALLRMTRSTFQWIPAQFNHEKFRILAGVQVYLETMNSLFKGTFVSGKVPDVKAFNESWYDGELSIFDKALEEFKRYRNTLEKNTLDCLGVLLGLTGNESLADVASQMINATSR